MKSTMKFKAIAELLAPLDHASTRRINLLCVVIIIAMGVVDHFLGPELSSAIFYVIPISIAAWYGSRWSGLWMSLFSACMWLLSDITAGGEVSSHWIFLWNMLVRLGLFIIISELIAQFRMQYNYRDSAANTDPLTGIFNYGGFFQQSQNELLRCQRYHHPVSVVFFDLDNFKWVNDHLGHAAGDELLQYICQLVISNIRKTDLFGRLGGDEFAILLTETAVGDAERLVEKVRGLLAIEMKERAWPVSFSMGLITFEDCPEDMKQVIQLADELMYSAKHGGKNNVVKLHYPSHADTSSAEPGSTGNSSVSDHPR